jgi:hypothetical protein
MSTGTIAPGAIWRRLIGAGSICAVLFLASPVAALAVAPPHAATPSGQASGGPGATSYLRRRDDCRSGKGAVSAYRGRRLFPRGRNGPRLVALDAAQVL